MKIILDTNILVMAFSRKSKYHKIIQAFQAEQYTLVVSNDILFEYEEILAIRYDSFVVDNFLDALLEGINVEISDARFHWHLIHQDVEDNKFIDLAIHANAVIVTEDNHFNVLNQIDFPKVNVLNIDAFMEILEKMT